MYARKIIVGFRMAVAFALFISYIMILFVPTHAFGGDNTSPRKLLIYAEKPSFLPQICKEIESLNDYETGAQMFQLLNIQNLAKGLADEADMDSIVREYESRVTIQNRDLTMRNLRDTLAHLFKRYETYVHVNMLEFHNSTRLEFQFLITDSLPDSTQKKINKFYSLITDKTRYEGFVIDISANDFLQKLHKGIKSLFKRSNRPPYALVKVNGKPYLSNSITYVGKGDMVMVDATCSYDLDDAWDELTFEWKQRKNTNDSLNKSGIDYTSVPLAINPSEPKQRITFSNTGDFLICLQVSDGAISSSTNLHFKVIEHPHFTFARLDTLIRRDASYLGPLLFHSNKKLNKVAINIPYSGISKDASPQITGIVYKDSSSSLLPFKTFFSRSVANSSADSLIDTTFQISKSPMSGCTLNLNARLYNIGLNQIKKLYLCSLRIQSNPPVFSDTMVVCIRYRSDPMFDVFLYSNIGGYLGYHWSKCFKLDFGFTMRIQFSRFVNFDMNLALPLIYYSERIYNASSLELPILIGIRLPKRYDRFDPFITMGGRLNLNYYKGISTPPYDLFLGFEPTFTSIRFSNVFLICPSFRVMPPLSYGGTCYLTGKLEFYLRFILNPPNRYDFLTLYSTFGLFALINYLKDR